MKNKRDLAIVLGGSISGLTTAGVLSKHFKKVILLERDTYPTQPENRSGVPQAHHLHLFLQRGQQVLEKIFPGIIGEFSKNGSEVIDAGERFIFLVPGGWLPRKSFGVTLLPASRGLIDHLIRKELEKKSNIQILQQTEILGLVSHEDRVSVKTAKQEFDADLIVDCTGRQSKVIKWLTEIGYEPPKEKFVNSHLGYASRLYERPPKATFPWDGIGVQADPPRCNRGGAILPVEGDRWMVTIGGGNKEYPPADEAGFNAFIDSLGCKSFTEAVAKSKPISKIYLYRQTENRWRKLEDLKRFPANLIMLGDAVSTFNPVYGQGMTMATLGADLLDRCLNSEFTPLKFQKLLAKQNQNAWMSATSEDFRYSLTEGEKPSPAIKLIHGYMGRVQRLSATDYETAKTFYQVLHMIEKPTALFKPRIFFKSLLARP